MDQTIITMHKERVTKNTVRYEEEVETGKLPIFKTLYVQNVVPNLPERIQITIENAPED